MSTRSDQPHLVATIAKSTRRLTFTAAALCRLRPVDTALDEALSTADIENAKQLGKLLRRVEGRDINGARIDRVSENREGIIWRASLPE